MAHLQRDGDRVFLDGLVGFLATHSPAHCRHQHLRGGQEGQVAVQLGGDHLGESPKVGEHGEEGLKQPVEREERVGQRHPPHHRAGDVALVPLVPGQLTDHGDVAAQDHRQPIDALAGAGVHLVGHGGAADLPLLEPLRDQFETRHQADGGGHVRRGRGGLRQGGDDVVVEATRIHLSRGGENGLETQLGGDPAFQLGQPACVAAEEVEHVLGGSDRPLDPARRVAGDELLQSPVRHQQLVGGGGEPFAQGGDLGRDVVGTTGQRLLGPCDGQPGQLRQGSDDAVADHAQRGQDLVLLDVLGEVSRGHALVDVFVAGKGVELLDPGLDVVAGDAFAGRDGFEVHLTCDRLVGGDHLVRIGAPEVDAQVALGAQHRQPEPALGDHLCLGRPDVAHLRGGVTGGQHIGDAHAGNSIVSTALSPEFPEGLRDPQCGMPMSVRWKPSGKFTRDRWS